jgi:hypothetical protein
MRRYNIVAIVFVIIVLICMIALSIYFINKNRENDSSKLGNSNINETTNNLQNEEIDNSAKVAKMFIPLSNKFEDKQFYKDITQNTINKIDKMLEVNEHVLGIIDFINAPNYIIEFNDTNIHKSIGFRVLNNHILVCLDYSDTYIIYREEDVKQLLSLLGEGQRYTLNYTEIDINKTYTPPKIYIDKMYEAVLGSYTWKDEKGNITTVDLKQDAIALLKDKEAIDVFNAPMISINSTDTDLRILPNNTKVSYSVYNGEEKIIEKDAERMIDGSYHTYQPNMLSEYIYKITITFTNAPGLSATYYFKYKV